MYFSLFSIVLLAIGLCSACNFKAVVRSETDHDMWARFTFPNKTDGEILKFSKYGETKNLTISGTFCNLQPTILKAWSKYPKKDDKPLGQTSAHLEGNGVMHYMLYPKEGPAAIHADRMLCAFGQCRLGRK